MCVNSTPVTPEPITQRCSGISFGGYASRVVRMRSPSTGAQSGTRGREPVASTTKSASSSLAPLLRLGDHLVRALQPAAPVDEPHALRLEQAEHRRRAGGSRSTRPARAARRRRACPSATRPIVRARVSSDELAAGGDHRLRRDAVPEVRGAADDVALDERDLGAERRRHRRRGVAAGPTTDDHEPDGHRARATRRALGYVPPVPELRHDRDQRTRRDRRRRARGAAVHRRGAADDRRRARRLPVLSRQRAA